MASLPLPASRRDALVEWCRRRPFRRLERTARLRRRLRGDGRHGAQPRAGAGRRARTARRRGARRRRAWRARRRQQLAVDTDARHLPHAEMEVGSIAGDDLIEQRGDVEHLTWLRPVGRNARAHGSAATPGPA
ncbi:MAG: hypothetical protein FJ293_04805 [Planctomycetes bacterium]|nr:hypothetical protein [Planctomycetota bacterium]